MIDYTIPLRPSSANHSCKLIKYITLCLPLHLLPLICNVSVYFSKTLLPIVCPKSFNCLFFLNWFRVLLVPILFRTSFLITYYFHVDSIIRRKKMNIQSYYKSTMRSDPSLIVGLLTSKLYRHEFQFHSLDERLENEQILRLNFHKKKQDRLNALVWQNPKPWNVSGEPGISRTSSVQWHLKYRYMRKVKKVDKFLHRELPENKETTLCVPHIVFIIWQWLFMRRNSICNVKWIQFEKGKRPR